jgi:GGDEF domain-containing protein
VYSNCKPKPTTGSNGRVVIPQFRRENIPDSGACNTRYGNWGMDTYIRNSELHVRIPPIPYPLTLSAGIAGGEVPEGEAVVEEWILKADHALLRAKETGRDRVTLA